MHGVHERGGVAKSRQLWTLKVGKERVSRRALGAFLNLSLSPGRGGGGWGVWGTTEQEGGW